MMREARHGWTDGEGSERKRHSQHDRKLPFGGAQVVVTGDFCQLPPVKPFKFCMQCGGDELLGWSFQDGRELRCKRCPLTYVDADKWAFRSKTWEDCNFSYFELKNIHRQNDEQFINIFQRCRLGQGLTQLQKELLAKVKPDPVGAVKLLPRRREVDNENTRNFELLTGTPRAYECLDVFEWRNQNEPELKKKGVPKYANRPDGPLSALNDHRFEEHVQLKVGMLVILLVNLDFPAGLVNGSQGRIVRFEKYDPNQPLITRQRESSPVRGQKLSRKDFGLHDNELFKEAQIRMFIDRAAIKEWPVIEFYNGETRPIYAHCQLAELGSEKPYSVLGHTQIPLLAAWAITIHKSQGMTLDRVIVDLYNSFEREMVYVALSRARNLEGLKVVRLARNMEQGVNKEVQQFLLDHFGTHDHTIPPARPTIRGTIEPWEGWRLAVEAAFANYSQMLTFPEPPIEPCSKMSCRTDTSRLLEACRCNIEAAFRRVGELKKERLPWHPDRFSKCPEQNRELFKKAANEVFVVIDALCQREEQATRS